MKWRKVSDYCITSGDWNICCIYVAGVPRYELWDLRGKRACFVAAYGTAAEARKAADERNSANR
jgi:hypothetical protein